MITLPIAVSSNGANALIAGVPGKVIRVFGWSISANGTVNVKFQSSVTPTDLTGYRYMVVNNVWDQPLAPMRVATAPPYFETLAGEGLTLFLSGAIACGGFVCYEITPV